MNSKFHQIGCYNLFDVILKIPKSYNNNFLIKSLNKFKSNIGALEVVVVNNKFFNKTLKVNATILPNRESLEITIFNAKHYHKQIFSTNKKLFLRGNFEFRYNQWHSIQPKVISQINTIEMKWNLTKLKSTTLNKMFREAISIEALIKLGIKGKICEYIYAIFHPESSLDSTNTSDFIEKFNRNNGLFGKYLYAIKFVEIFYYMKNLREKKREFLATNPLNGDYKGFIKSLPFTVTKGQSECIEKLSCLLDSTKATRCVVMGDVGCGKTIVILSCVMVAYPKKSLLLAPTTILAKQLYDNAKKFLPSHINIALALKNKDIVECDFLIGTHTLLFRELSTFDLFMTDEQHRFGTNQRLKIESMLSIEGRKPHCIQFSATPIPRTMALIESNLVDFIFIKDLPFKKNITTQIISKTNFSNLITHIKKQVEQNNQVAIIYPLVEKSESIDYQSLQEGLPFWEKNFERVYCTHGKDKLKEEIIEEFRDNGSILLATTLFEVGISLPKLTTIVIVGAERLGFATLHQLRGRVSRNGLQGFCYLYTKRENSTRLVDFTKTTNGFEIAELDLKYRNSGDIIRGIKQSGEQFSYFEAQSDRIIAQNAKKLLDRI